MWCDSLFTDDGEKFVPLNHNFTSRERTDTKRDRGEVSSAVMNILETDLPTQEIKLKKYQQLDGTLRNYDKRRDRGELASAVFNVMGKECVQDIQSGKLYSNYKLNEENPLPFSGVSTIQSIMPIVEIKKKSIEMEGYLLKKGAKVKNWKKRYFIIKQTTLKYFTEENGRLINTITIGGDCRVEVQLGKKGNHVMYLHCPDRIWEFKTEKADEDLFEKWRCAIQDAIWTKVK